jgi:two-component system chemotaxis response regulator CheB
LINVLIVEDSAVVREFLFQILASDPGIRVVGTAADGEDALTAVRGLKPDVITMDIHMPKIDGIATTRQIMETHPTPIIIITGSTDPGDVETTFRALDAGALAVLPRPTGIDHPEHETTARELIQTVKLMAEVKVIRRWPRVGREIDARRIEEQRPIQPSEKIQIVAIGASTGGPPVVQRILESLAKDFPAPILLVQHMATGFTDGFVRWLSQSSTMPVHLAIHGEQILPGHVYVAPDEHQMKVGRGGRIVLNQDSPEHGLRPSVSYLFRSVGEAYGSGIVAGLLSGMGRDGAIELMMLKNGGALTFVQDRESSVVHGMAGEAIKLGAATLVLSAEKIGPTLMSMALNSKNAGEKL